MTLRNLAALLLCVALVAANPTSQPSTQPATQPMGKYPTPAELMAKIRKQRKDLSSLLKVAYFDLNRPLTERPGALSLFGADDDRSNLRSLVDRLHRAADDKDLRAVLITFSADAGMNYAQAQEIRDAIKDVRRQGKKVFVYADSYDTISYSVACAATNICLMEGGEIEIPGVGFQTMFYKGIFDKLGVQADYIQIGEYKGAEEPYTRTGPSDELRGELTKLADAYYDQIIDGISISRGVSRSQVKQLIDDTELTAPVAKEQGFVDHLVDEDGLRDLITQELGGKVNIIPNYGTEPRQDVDLSNPFALLSMLSKKPAASTKPAIAIIYADGEIVDGEGADGLFSDSKQVGSESMRRAFRVAMRDDNVKAVVLRIDSPGGSALASEAMWQSVRHLAAKKPVVVSVGGMAASGGYYLACSGDTIFADPSAIVGSIGVVGGKLVMKDLFEKIGLGTETFKVGRNAGLYSMTEPWDDRQKRLVRNWMQETYDLFTRRVMATRKNKIADIDKVARGRIFLARDAKALGMVDEIGGLDDALTFTADKVKLHRGDYDVQILPAPRTLADLLGFGNDPQAKLPITPKVTISPDSVLHLLSPETDRLVMQQIEMIQLLQRRPYVLMTPYVMTDR
ncbi:MAG TPA: signal peptide peptidase SppA [Tepidisphaeraceae bacterium]|jgi:protease-4|nr:signal peptide peptidase SppA [Tepidisphaeraceae bacterium]